MGQMAEPGLRLAQAGVARLPQGRQDSSIWKNIVLPVYYSSGLHYGKNVLPASSLLLPFRSSIWELASFSQFTSRTVT
jgi:hypothetical protein